MPKKFEDLALDANKAAGVKSKASTSYKRKSPQPRLAQPSKIVTPTDGPSFGARGLELFTPEIGKDGKEVMKDGRPNMVPIDMLKFARQMNRKGMQSTLSASDSMALWKPGATSRIPAANAMQNYTGLNFAAISALSDEISGIVWELYQIKKDGEHEQVLSHEILDLLDAPNPEQTGPEFKFRIASHLELAGNCFIVMRKKNGQPISNEDEKPAMLTTLNPGQTIIDIDKSSDVDVIKGYIYRKNAVEYRYQRFQVMHLKRPNPNSELEGIGTTQCIAEWIDVDNDGMEFNRQFFLHGSYLTATIETEATDEDQIDSMRESFMEQHAGVQNANKVLMLMKGMKLTQNLQPKDMAFDKLLAVTAQRIHAGTRVSSTMLGTAEADTNRATAETADYVFAKRLVKPRFSMICQQMNDFLVSRYEDGLYLSFTDPTPEDKQFKTVEMQAVAANMQVLTINEVREKYMGLGPIEGGDTLFRANTQVPIDTPALDPTKPDPNATGTPQKPKKPASSENEPDEPKKPKKLLELKHLVFRPQKTRFVRNRDLRKGMADEIASKLVDVIKGIHAEKPWNLDFKKYAIIAKESSDRQNDARAKLEEAAADYLGRQCKEVIGNLSNIMKAIDPTKLIDVPKSVQLVIDFSTPILTKLATDEGMVASEAVSGVGIDVMQNETYANAVDQSINLLGQKYTDTSLADVKTTIEASLKAGDSIDQLTEKVRQYYSEAQQTRAAMLARTESFRISNSATKEAWRQTGVVKAMKWFTSPLDNVCEFCQALNGKEIPIDGTFFSKGDVATGANGGSMNLDYDEVGAPPLHPNCGCYLQPSQISVD